jgi:hypothetical protein
MVPKYLILKSLQSHGFPSSLLHGAFSPSHSYYRPPIGVVALHRLFLYSDTPPSRPSSSRLAQAIFLAKPLLTYLLHGAESFLRS